VETEDLNQNFYLYSRPRVKGPPVWYVKFRDPKTRVILHGRTSKKTNKVRARDWAESEYARISKEGTKKPLTLRAFAADFWSDECAYVRRKINDDGHYSNKTKRDNRSYLKRYILEDEVADLLLSRIDKDEVLGFRDRLIEDEFDGKACRSVQKIMSALRIIVNFAREKSLIDTNPFFRVKLGAYEEEERIALSEEELDTLLKRENFKDALFWEATTAAAATGMRAGEVRGLQVGDLRPKAVPVPLIFVERQLVNQTLTEAPPKWGKKRTCPYPSVLRDLFEPRCKDRSPGEYVFTLNYTYWRDALTEAAKKAGVKATLHTLRHTLNTILIQRGIPEGVIRSALGWSDPKIQARYTHIDTFGATYRSPLIDSVVEAIQGKAPARAKKAK